MINSLTQITQIRLINLRWLSVLGMVLAAIISPNILGSPALVWSLLAVASMVGGLNACLLVATKFHLVRVVEVLIESPLFQLGFDLLSWGGYVYLSGGAANPLISVFLPLVAMGATVLNKVQAWCLGFAAILLYSFLWRFHQAVSIGDTHDHDTSRVHLLGMWFVFVVSTIVVIWFILRMSQAVRERDAALAQAREKAIRNDWLISMGSLAAGAAHELSTPLATLNVLIDEFHDNPALSNQMQEDIGLMRRQVDACKQALTQLTQRAGHPRNPSSERVALQSWLKTNIDAWQSLHPSANLELKLSAELDVSARGLDLMLERVLSNLLDNAFEAGAALISVEATVIDKKCVLTVQDNGPGISDAALKAFEQGQPIESERGMGIGLLLSRSTVERLGGTLALQRVVGRGSCANMTLPLQTAEATA